MQDCCNVNKQMGGASFKGVLHIGAHKGEEIQAYTECGIKQILWVEANKHIMKDLYDQTKMFPLKQQYINEILSDVEGEKVRFNVTNDTQCSSILPFGTLNKHHPNINIVEVRELVTPDAVTRLAAGIVLDKVKTKPAIVKKLSKSTFSIVLVEGRKHQIRRMCDACRLTIESLTRVRIGHLKAGSMKPGFVKRIPVKDIELLKKGR